MAEEGFTPQVIPEALQSTAGESLLKVVAPVSADTSAGAPRTLEILAAERSSKTLKIVEAMMSCLVDRVMQMRFDGPE